MALMNATVAHEATLEINSAVARDLMVEVEQHVNSAIAAGQFETWVSAKKEIPAVTAELRKLGYRVEIQSDRNDSLYHLTW